MKDEVERYKRICSQLDLYKAQTQETFNRFITLSLASVGGFGWLSTQPDMARVGSLISLGRWVLPVLAAVTVIELAIEYPVWWGYRMAESEILNKPELKPRLPRSARSEIFRSLIAIGVGVAGYRYLR